MHTLWLSTLQSQNAMLWEWIGWLLLLLYALGAAGLIWDNRKRSALPYRPWLQAVIAVMCGIFSFTLTFLFLHRFRTGDDFVWIVLRCLLPTACVAVVLTLNGRFSCPYIFLGAGVQYALLILFAKPLFQFLFLGDLDRGYFGSRWLEYIGSCFAYPVVVTLGQFALLWLPGKFRKK